MGMVIKTKLRPEQNRFYVNQTGVSICLVVSGTMRFTQNRKSKYCQSFVNRQKIS